MKFRKATGERSVQAVRCTGLSGSNNLTWESYGLDEFLVLVGEKKDDVTLDETGVSVIKSMLQDAEEQISEQDYISFSNIGVTVYKVAFSHLKQKGGFSANGSPGIYAVYGLKKENGEYVIYISDNNVVRFTVDVSITDVPVTASKGVFKKKEVYSGYHKITLAKGIPGVKGNTLYYTVSQNNYRYPFPEEIVANGGSFYVKCEENESLRFGTTNKDGIRLK